MSTSSNDSLIGVRLGDYTLEKLLAVGGMSRVYVATDENLERKSAVKVLETSQDWVDETITDRFVREAKAVAALEHDNIITIYQYGEQDGTYFIAMQFVEGEDLAKILKSQRRKGKPMPVARALALIDQIANALDFAHAAGIIHRDIKPSNILVTPSDKAILTDFGLVLRASVDATMGTAFGTPRYIAPEQAIASAQAVPQSDIYALAVIIYEMLCGETPFDGDSPMEIALAHVSETPPPPSSKEKSIPKAVDDVLLKALSKEPDDRYDSATEMLSALRRGYSMVEEEASMVPYAQAMPDVVTEPTPDEQPVIVTEANIQHPPKKRRGIVPKLLTVLLLIAGGVGAVLYLGDSSLLGRGAEITLFYNDESIVVHNGGDYTLNTQQLSFVRGAPNDGGDDYNGDRIRNDQLPSGACFPISLQSGERLSPAQCQSTHGGEFLQNVSLFFWRTEPVDQATFEVRFGNRVLERCETVSRGGTGECRFIWPEGPQEQNDS